MEMNIKFAEKLNIAKEKVNENDALKDEFKAAVLELELIRNYINYVDDPDLIEYAIYAEKAIQKRIAYILKKLR
ncbi:MULTISPECIES: hypothetical protein [Caloramator]|uniref:Uncharacterized protein n=1 Tax=Caloramator australicus RC3 TaxID=857293 RepID=I7K9R2_9CLOT|nr:MULTISPECIES: hypothetical protein [Caloramator]MDO6353478.1 hypothetical protein [Caloramator sp. CAR-1]WDU83078.1 hypothetical protein PWK10_17140 [Caloramator sp. Dgby_cultured_2]CCJ34370.1 hypothetical protein CAAU_2286 [Caloramator australicus RC3]